MNFHRVDALKKWVKETYGWDVEVLSEFKVFHHEWEYDGLGWIISHNGIPEIILTNHGSFTLSAKYDLVNLIDGYVDVINETKEAIKLYDKLEE